jgi:O-antigen/teichoic acid export membrane protein
MTTPALALPAKPALRPAIANLGSVLSGEASIRVATFCCAVLIARRYGIATFGIYATALAYLTAGAMIADNGLQAAAIQQVAKARENRTQIIARLYFTKTFLIGVALILLLAVTLAIHLSREVATICALLAVRTALQSYSQLNASILKGLGNMAAIAISQTLHSGFLILGAAAVYARGDGIAVLLAIMVAAQALEFAISGRYVGSVGIHPVRVIRIRECWELARISMPMGLTFGMANLGVRLDVVMLSLVVSAEKVGQFAAAQSLYVITSVVSWLFGSVLLAEMSRIARDQPALSRYVAHWTRLLLATTLPAAIAGVWLAPWILRAAFGNNIHAAIDAVTVLVLATPLLFLNSLLLNRSIARGHTGTYVTSQAGALTVGLLTALVAAPALGGLGVALAATAAREGTLLTLLLSGWPTSTRRAS